MKTVDLITALREDFISDTRRPYGWDDENLLRAINEAERQACRRALLILDEVTAQDNDGVALCSLPVLANTASYAMSKKILIIKSIRLAALDYSLTLKTRGELDAWVLDWITLTGDPEFFIFEQTNFLRLVRIPENADTASLQVNRLPLSDQTLNKLSTPEIPDQYHYDLLDYAASLCYRKNDSDTLNLPLAQFHEQQFTAKFGPLPNAKQEHRRRSLPPTTRMKARAFGF